MAALDRDVAVHVGTGERRDRRVAKIQLDPAIGCRRPGEAKIGTDRCRECRRRADDTSYRSQTARQV